MKDLLDDLNYAITTDNLLSDDKNIELLEEAIVNWQELLEQIQREKDADKRFIRRNELDEETALDLGL